MIWEHNLKRNRDRNVISPANFLDWQRQSQSFEGMSAFTTNRMTLTRQGEPIRIQAEIATADYFTLLSVFCRIGQNLYPRRRFAGSTADRRDKPSVLATIWRW